MRSKTRRKVLFIVFSALIMVGLIIGVFADYDSMVGYYSFVAPYNIGEQYVSLINTHSLIEAGVYYWHFHINQYPDSELSIVSVDSTSISIYYNDDDSLSVNLYDADGESSSDYVFYLDGNRDIYIYCNMRSNVYVRYSSSNYDGSYISSDFYSINDTYSIDIYDNSQDVWASVVSVVNNATDSVINNDLLLLFAAAVPVISFGVGFLIRLKYRG